MSPFSLGILGSARVAAGGTSLSYTYVGTKGGNATMSGAGPYTATITGVNFGTASADRTLIVAYTVKGTASTPPLSMTVAGTSATLDATAANRYGMTIARVALPTGTSGTVEVTMNTSVAAYDLVVYSITGGTVSVADFATDTGAKTTTTTTVDAASGGCIIAISYERFAGAHTWTGATEDIQPYAAFASVATATAGPVTVSCVWGTATNACAATVAYQGA